MVKVCDVTCPNKKKMLENVFTDVVLVIDKTHPCYKDVKKVLHLANVKDLGSHYRVEGSFNEVNKLVDALKSSSGPPVGAASPRRDGHYLPVQHVLVSSMVMEYIEQKCRDTLDKIQGDSVVLVKKHDIGASPSKSGGTVSVTFRRRGGSPYPADGFHYNCVRQRFITFYQRTASDLQTVRVHLSSQDQAALQCTFPKLLFKRGAGRQEVTVTGPFGHVAQLRELLSPPPQGSSRTSNTRAPANPRGSRASASPTRRADAVEETCVICMDKIAPVNKETLRCGHSFCKDCLKMAFAYKPVCPTCGQVYGVMTGTQPAGGTMTVTKSASGLPGYERYATIVINYHIPKGVQKDEHPNPGRPYEGVSRRAYLPDSTEGKAVLGLLQRAFNQRLTFTIGRSTTSGRNGVITWNDIHHKTSTHGGPTNYGYPDPDYLRRVRDELKAKGIQ